MELRISLDLLSDGTILLHNNLVQAEGSLDGVGLLVHPLELLESTALGLDTGGIESVSTNSERLSGR